MKKPSARKRSSAPRPLFAASGTAKGLLLKAVRPVDEAAFMGAAYRMIGEAFVALDKKKVWLRAKDLSRDKSGAALAARFREFYDQQEDFWKSSRAAEAERALILQEALAQAAPPSAPVEDAFGELSPERKAEIAALLAEPPIQDTFGIARTWMETRRT